MLVNVGFDLVSQCFKFALALFVPSVAQSVGFSPLSLISDFLVARESFAFQPSPIRKIVAFP